MCVRWDGGTPTCSSKMQVGRLAVKSSTQRPHCKSQEHAGDGEQIPAAVRDWFKNLSCLCTFVSALGADWLLLPELDQWASVAPDAKRRPTAAMPVWTWSHNPGRGRRERSSVGHGSDRTGPAPYVRPVRGSKAAIRADLPTSIQEPDDLLDLYVTLRMSGLGLCIGNRGIISTLAILLV